MYNCAGEVHSGWTSTDHGPQTQYSEYVCYCSCWSRYGTPRSFENLFFEVYFFFFTHL